MEHFQGLLQSPKPGNKRRWSANWSEPGMNRLNLRQNGYVC